MTLVINTFTYTYKAKCNKYLTLILIVNKNASRQIYYFIVYPTTKQII